MEAPTKAPSIHDFQLLKPISRGAFGKVFLARKEGGTKLFAIKIVSKEEMKRKNLVDKVTAERNALAVSKCPYIVHLYYSLQTTSHIYLVMEYLIGGDLKTLLLVLGYLKDQHAAIYTVEISIALEYLHAHGIIHRDLKPDNILITAAGHLKLTDFGLSTLSWNHPIRASDVLNTPSVASVPLEYYRTPGQLISLTTELSFTDSPLVREESREHLVRHGELTQLGASSSVVDPPKRNEDNSPLNLTICSHRSKLGSEKFVTDLTAQLDQDKIERSQWRRRILQAIRSLQSEESSLHDAGFIPTLMSPTAHHRKNPVSLSEVIHEESLLTLTEVFAGAEPEEVDLVKSFLSRFSVSQILHVGLLVRQSSMPVSISPPVTSRLAGSISYRRSVSTSSTGVGPLRRCKSYCQPEIRKPYRMRHGRRLYNLPWSPTFLKDPQPYAGDALRRATLPPLPRSPECDVDCGMDWQKESFSLSVDETNSHIPTTTPSQSESSNAFIHLEESPRLTVSPLRHELVQLQLRSGGVSAVTSPREQRFGQQRTPPEVPLSSIEKTRLQQLYSPARLSAEDLQYGMNLADIDPAHPYMLYPTSSSFRAADTPLRTPRVLPRHRSHTGQKENSRPFPVTSFHTPSSHIASRHLYTTTANRISNVHFGSSTNSDTPLSVICELPVHSASSVKFAQSSFEPCAPPPSPVVPTSREYDVRAVGFDTVGCTALSVTPQLLGTPEYIAPELLSCPADGRELVMESEAVDWWALGIILFEMLTGCTPFADDSPDAVFRNIIDMDIPWPSTNDEPPSEELSQAAVQLISGLLSRSPSQRLLVAKQLRCCDFLRPVGDWNRLNELEMPFVPNPDDSTDTSYFQPRNDARGIQMTCSGLDMKRQHRWKNPAGATMDSVC
ncbi:hypothetical protein CRM22_002857 [Opisthorchis felineus]|uniref:Serine/threonine-protein kinase greatwall n=1 Tax=Opisthorchis felineus TaxID=147828 RepID=A0A4S2M3Z7_OPIFE|nr:hypothetical protein CRM22_002857 [Opisthorchis felineus]